MISVAAAARRHIRFCATLGWACPALHSRIAAMIESAVQWARNAKRYTRKAVDCGSSAAGKSGSPLRVPMESMAWKREQPPLSRAGTRRGMCPRMP